MPQEVRWRRIQTVPYNANNIQPESLARGTLYRELILSLSGQLTVSAANNTAANTLKGDEWAVVKFIRIVANGTTDIVRVDGNALWWFNYFWYGVKPQVTPTIGDGATLDPSFNATLVLPFWTFPNAVRPIDSLLNTGRLSDLKIEVEWGSHLDINASATGFTTAPQILVHVAESFNLVPGTPDAQLPFTEWRRGRIEKEITANNVDFDIELPTNALHRGYLINFEDADADSGAILNRFKLVSGNVTFVDFEERALHEWTRIHNQLDRDYSGVAYDDFRQGNANSVNGWYWLDLISDGVQTEALDARALAELKLVLDVNVGGGTTKVFVYPQLLIPPA